MGIKRLQILLVLLALTLCAVAFRAQLRRPVAAFIQVLMGKKTIDDRVAQYGDAARARLAPAFERVGVAYPPQRATLVGLKAERTLQVWVSGAEGQWMHLKDYPILGMSGGLGPKLEEGDLQVPEGLYQVESLNSNSRYHLALRVNYPNAQDRRRGIEDGRANLGSDIMIHGKDCSVGCLAMGDEASEDLFVLAAESGIDNVAILLSPVDFRVRGLPEQHPPLPSWCDNLYDGIKNELEKLGKQARP